jgi:chromosome segregation ATPase
MWITFPMLQIFLCFRKLRHIYVHRQRNREFEMARKYNHSLQFIAETINKLTQQMGKKPTYREVRAALPGGAGNDRISAAFKLVRASVEAEAATGSVGHQETDMTKAQNFASALLADIEKFIPGLEKMLVPLISMIQKAITQALHAQEEEVSTLKEQVTELKAELISAREEITKHDKAIAAAHEATATAQNAAGEQMTRMKAKYQKSCIKIAQKAYSDGLHCLDSYDEYDKLVGRKHTPPEAYKKTGRFPVSLTKRPHPPPS